MPYINNYFDCQSQGPNAAEQIPFNAHVSAILIVKECNEICYLKRAIICQRIDE